MFFFLKKVNLFYYLFKMASIFINGTTVVLANMELDSYSVLQHCELANVDIPRFCYHDHLTIAGNCRLCVVELSSSFKPVISCATELSDNMQIFTNSFIVMQARESVMEFILINHPLDCPICDQGGECDLQEFSYVYGSDSSRFFNSKRFVSDKYFGPLIKSIMTRCIHCTRCIRFMDEIVGYSSFGTLGRGSSTEIGTFSRSSYINTEVLGNVVDICPVGALTSKPYSFTARSWELVSTESIDILDSLCSNIRIDSRGSEIMRILPRLNTLINNEWITDKIRFSYDGLKRQRVLSPLCRDYKSNVLHICSWQIAFSLFRNRFITFFDSISLMHSVYFFAGHLIDSVAFFFFRLFCNAFGVSNINVHFLNDVDLRLNYLISDKLSSLFNNSSVFLFMGVNLKLESPILNIRLQTNIFATQVYLRVGYIGTHIFSTYPLLHIGLCSSTVITFFFGKSFFCTEVATSCSNTTFLLGSSVHVELHNLCSRLSYSYFSTNYLCLYSGDINLHELCVLQSYNSRSIFSIKHSSQLMFLLGADFLRQFHHSKQNFIVYIGHNYNDPFLYSDLILPSCAFTEKDGLYLNCQGKVQRAGHAISSAGSSLTNECIMYSLLRYTFKHNSICFSHSFDFFNSCFKKYLPYSLNYVSSFIVCRFLLSFSFFRLYISFNIFVIFLRNFYETDIISCSISFKPTMDIYSNFA